MGILVVLAVHAECSLGPVTFYGGMFYMPVFFVAAGYTYRCRREEPWGKFLKKKAGRLLVPYFGTSAFLWLFFWLKDSVLGGTPMDLKPAALAGILYSRNQMYTAAHVGANPGLLTLLNAPLWFLTAIFLTYVYYEAVSRWSLRKTEKKSAGQSRKYAILAAGLLISVVWHYATDLLLPWSLEAVPYFACFFTVGEWIREKNVVNFLTEGKHLWITVLLLGAFLLLSGWNGSVNLSCGVYGRSVLLYLVIGSFGSLLVFLLGKGLEQICRPLVCLCSMIGQETLTILCLHMFLYMFIRTGAGILGCSPGLTRVLLVLGSLVMLTAAGRIRHR